MEVNVLKELFRAGALNGIQITPALMAEHHWIIIVNHIIDSQIIVTTQRGDEKRYRGISTAMEDVRRIGFKEVMTVLPSADIPIKR